MVEVQFLGKAVDFTKKGSCFGFFNILGDTPDFKKCDSLTFYPYFYGRIVDISNLNTFLRDVLYLINPYLITEHLSTKISVESILKKGIQMSTQYPSPFIVGIFEIVRDAFYYPAFVNNYSYIYRHIYNKHICNTRQCIQLAYYIAKMQHTISDSALHVQNIRKKEWKFLDESIIKPKLLNYKSIKECSNYIGVNSLFRYGELVGTKGKETLFYKQAPIHAGLPPEVIDRRIRGHNYSDNEIQEIIDIII